MRIEMVRLFASLIYTTGPSHGPTAKHLNSGVLSIGSISHPSFENSQRILACLIPPIILAATTVASLSSFGRTKANASSVPNLRHIFAIVRTMQI